MVITLGAVQKLRDERVGGGRRLIFEHSSAVLLELPLMQKHQQLLDTNRLLMSNSDCLISQTLTLSVTWLKNT